MMRRAVPVLRVVLRGAFALAMFGASAALAQTPGYITAKPDATIRAFGQEAAGRIFSNAYTPVRQQAVLRSQKTVPGFECPSDPQIALSEIIPYPIQQGAVSWIERYVVACTPRTMRNFLMVMEGQQPRAIELLPGSTNADPMLQRDALQGATAAVATKPVKSCDKPAVIETRLVSKIERGAPWTEHWTYDLCGTRAQIEMIFTPSPNAGTTWSAKLLN